MAYICQAGQIYIYIYIPDLAWSILPNVAGREPYNLRDLAYVEWVGSVCSTQLLRNLSQRQVMDYICSTS